MNPVSALIPVDPVLQELRLAALASQAPLEYVRVIYGLSDQSHGRDESMVAQDVARVARLGTPVTKERAEQRARSYLPMAGHEHCPRCWVLTGAKNPLHYREATPDRPEAARCKVCRAEYTSTVD